MYLAVNDVTITWAGTGYSLEGKEWEKVKNIPGD